MVVEKMRNHTINLELFLDIYGLKYIWDYFEINAIKIG